MSSKSVARGGAHEDRTSAGMQQRRRGAGSGSFTSRQTASTRSLHEFRRRKERKFVQNASLLREYRRVAKSEGYDAGKGASRKRERGKDDGEEEQGDGSDSRNGPFAKWPRKEGKPDEGEEAEGGGECGKPGGRHKKRPKKTDPFAKARAQAEVRRKGRKIAEAQREKRRREEGAKAKKRKERYRQMTQRTKKGQPIMKNVVAGMLDKLQREARR